MSNRSRDWIIVNNRLSMEYKTGLSRTIEEHSGATFWVSGATKSYICSSESPLNLLEFVQNLDYLLSYCYPIYLAAIHVRVAVQEL